MIKTERLVIRNFENTETDIQGVFNIFSDIEVNKFLPMFPLTNLKNAKDFYNKKIRPLKNSKGFYYAICLLEDNVPIGYLTLTNDDSHDFGYGLIKKYWGMGIVTEAASATLNHIAAKNLDFFTATHDIKNIGSGKVMKKIGMTYRYSYKEQWQPKDKLVTFRMYQYDFKSLVKTYDKYWYKYPEHFIENIDSF